MGQKEIKKTIFFLMTAVLLSSVTPPEVKDSELEEVYGGFVKPVNLPSKTGLQKIILWDEKNDYNRCCNKN
ncbi:hypothetical protein [Persephonella sp.]